MENKRWNADQSVHMIMYNRHIHDEKIREEKLLRESLTDPLTGLYNHRFMDEQLDRIIKSLARADGNISVLMLDVDFFKKYNNIYGHVSGDACLKKIAVLLLRAVSRVDNIAARYGGGEFLLTLPNTDENGARLIAQCIMRDLEECTIPHEQNPPVGAVTVSIGGVTGRAADILRVADFVDEADKALYESKQNGRNCFTGKLFAPVDPGDAILVEP